MNSMSELNQLLIDMMLSSDEEMQKWDNLSTQYHELKLKVDKM